MEIELFGNAILSLPPLPITIIAIIIIYMLYRWSKELTERRFTIFFYFILSTTTTILYSQSTETGIFNLWVPLGFIIVCFYLYKSKRYHPVKMKAALLGLCFAIYHILKEYGFLSII